MKSGGFTTGGFNFDTKLRRQSLDRNDLFHGHIGGIDTLARSLLVAAELVENGRLAAEVADRYRGWNSDLGRTIEEGVTLSDLATRVEVDRIDPSPVSGRQEHLENIVNRAIWSTR